MVRLFIL